MARLNSPEALERFRQEILSKRDPNKPCITLCSGSACHASGSGEVAAALEAEIKKQGLSDAVEIRRTGCHGFCERGPIIVIHPDEICYFQITPDDIPEIISKTIKEKSVIERLLYTDPGTNKKIIHESEIPFYKNQQRLVFGSNGSIDPKSVDDYLAIGGYAALAKALSRMTDEEVLGEVKKSNLRGRGGAGFPAGSKWEGSRNAPEPIKYVIVNADEGDPGAFMNRSLLEGDPHALVEGMIIAGRAIGATKGYIY
ncbi:MAG: NAD(P)H-dependent oxidoreductase subunit E, partial [Desulfobacterales bacterium]|nr:NAD(P)H-dependent oxidoreductase subunit E [Desulfobacterales bacterium]